MASGGNAQRLLRSGAFALVTVLLAAAAHELAGGRVAPLTAVAAWFGVLVVANPVLGRRRGLPVLLPLTAAVQTALHLAFMVPAGGGSMQVTGGAHHGTTVVTVTPAEGAGWGDLTSPMMLAHLVAALALSALLLRGEDVLVAVLGLLGLRLAAPPRLPYLPPVPRLVVRPEHRLVLPTVVLARSISRRGPPAGFRAAGLLPG